MFEPGSSSSFVSCRHRFAQPLARPGDVSVIEVSAGRFRERLENHRHGVLPLLITDHRESLNVGKMFEFKFDVFHAAPASQPWQPVILNSTRILPCCRSSRSNSETKSG